jgi:acetyl-CoA C-acetyltransferase
MTQARTNQAYIVDALRSPTGRRKGGLSHVHAIDLGAHVLKTLVERNAIPAEDYDDVIFGCVDTIGSQAGDIARTAWLAAGLPLNVPGTTVDRQCGSSQQALHFAAQAVMSGTQDVVAVGGVQTMTQIPISSAMLAGQPLGFPTRSRAARAGRRASASSRSTSSTPPSASPTTGASAAPTWKPLRWRATAAPWPPSRPATSSARSPSKASAATKPRATTLDKMASLEPVGADYPSITAAVSSQTCDASAALLVVSEAALKRYGLTPRARIHHLSVLGDDPIWHLTAPIPATAPRSRRPA